MYLEGEQTAYFIIYLYSVCTVSLREMISILSTYVAYYGFNATHEKLTNLEAGNNANIAGFFTSHSF